MNVGELRAALEGLDDNIRVELEVEVPTEERGLLSIRVGNPKAYVWTRSTGEVFIIENAS